ncbi:nuclear transport factor 2 family protein [Nocardia sp. A7]|uniref:nuclear transport factor 2 family protein n=1 Tax=Nocardia sp. A7 TaxID=2789274 RepID=UPI003979108A
MGFEEQRDRAESLLAAERRLQAAQLTSDVEVLAELIDDSARFTGPDGVLLSKQDDLRAHETGHLVMGRVDEEDVEVLVTAHLGVTWFLGYLEATIGGEAIAARMRYTRTWTDEGESGWRVVAAHASVVADAPDKG